MKVIHSKIALMKKSIEFSIATLDDIPSILALQKRYLVSNLTEEEKKSGFVTTPFTIEQLEFVINHQGVFLAKNKAETIAYIIGSSWEFFQQWPIFEYMITLFPHFHFREFHFTTLNSFQYGPICIEKNYRGMGLIQPFFEFMRMYMKDKYPLSLTFINKKNLPSFKAHTEKLHWKVIDEFQFNNNHYYVLAYEMQQKVTDFYI